MNGKLITACLIPLLVTACSGDGKTTKDDGDKEKAQATSAVTQAPKGVATVNGKVISEESFTAYFKRRQNELPAGTTRERILDELINFELVIQDALSRGLDKKPAVANELEQQRRNILANAAFREYMVNNPLTDEQMRTDYEARMQDLTFTEYKLRHILTEDEATATKALAELEKGADIIKLVKKYSSDPSATEGGDLGWQSEDDVIPAIRDKVKTLKKGEHVKEIIKTSFGWHVVYMEDRHDSPPPPYEEVKDRVREVLQRQQISKYIISLRTAGNVDINEPAGDTPAKPAKADDSDKKPDHMMENY